MAFKKKAKSGAVPDSPDKLLVELPRRKIPDVLPHQQEIMRSYAAKAIEAKDVALQLPTGSGKTLVGLLIAEWRRRKFSERVVYLCPTRQLVNQTVEQGEEKYGLTLSPFVGRIADYPPDAKAKYRGADHVAVTTYSSLFNTNPFFNDADLVIVDDAHTAENYIGGMWSLRIDRSNSDHNALHSAVSHIIKPLIDGTNYARLIGDWNAPSDRTWVDKLPTPDFSEIKDEISTVISAHAEKAKLHYAWSLIRDHLPACHLYLSAHDILIRPITPPTWTHAPFSDPKQRLFMSATLGAGGDLERMTGRHEILRLPVPKDWDRQGVGRRFFMFPGMSLKDEVASKLRRELMTLAGRSLVLVPNDRMREEIASDIETNLKFDVFGADDIEDSKKPFVAKGKAVAVVANRYDGIDFPGKECRLLFVDGLPRATNSQERFFMSRMGANVLFNERIQTRVLQAIGRCTRSLEDYSAVVVTGEELPDYLSDHNKRKYLHPELQAELSFGIDQSKGTAYKDFVENFKTFIENGKDWEEVNKDIVAERASKAQKPFPAIQELSSVAVNELKYQKAIWNADYEAALGAAEAVLSGLKLSELQGYRALWHYLAGSAAWYGAGAGVSRLEAKSRSHFEQAKKASSGIPWLVALARFQPAAASVFDIKNETLMLQIEHVEEVLAQLGTTHEGKFAVREKNILEGLNSKDKGPFQEAHKLLGELIGFSSANIEAEGSPDPWWISKKLCFVFEDHQGAEKKSKLDTKKARQAASHPQWIKKHVPEANGLDIIPVLVSPVTQASPGAMPHLENVCFWPLDEFRTWAK